LGEPTRKGRRGAGGELDHPRVAPVSCEREWSVEQTDGVREAAIRGRLFVLQGMCEGIRIAKELPEL